MKYNFRITGTEFQRNFVMYILGELTIFEVN